MEFSEILSKGSESSFLLSFLGGGNIPLFAFWKEMTTLVKLWIVILTITAKMIVLARLRAMIMKVRIVTKVLKKMIESW